MPQTTILLDRHTVEEGRFEGIGPYAREQFRLVSAPKKPAAVALPSPAQPRTDSRPLDMPADIEAWERRVYVSTRWCDVGLSLLILASGAAALFHLVWAGQP